MVISAAGACALPFAWLHLNTAARYRHQRHYLLFAFGCLALFGLLCSQLTPQATLWQIALPLLILLAGQTLLMFVFTNFIVFRVMGRDYDAAVISSGVCGFGMGATPNAMANMQALCEKYAPSVKAYLLIPLVGSLFADFINSLVTTFFINFI